MHISNFLRFLPAGIILLSLSACAWPPPPTPDEVLVYDCERADIVTAQHGDTLNVYLLGGTYTLPRVQTTSGVKYSNGPTSFWVEGETASLETAFGSYPSCRVNHRRIPWEDARVRGVIYRAVGQEPGWLLEIDPATIRAELDYGAREVSVGTPWPKQEPGVTSYRQAQIKPTVEVLLKEKTCKDTMSGEEFELTVTLTVDEKSYRGCGRKLQE